MTYDDARQEMADTPPTAVDLLMFTAALMPISANELAFMLTLGIYDPARTRVIQDLLKTQTQKGR